VWRCTDFFAVGRGNERADETRIVLVVGTKVYKASAHERSLNDIRIGGDALKLSGPEVLRIPPP
jgi:hypothetical protein